MFRASHIIGGEDIAYSSTKGNKIEDESAEQSVFRIGYEVAYLFGVPAKTTETLGLSISKYSLSLRRLILIVS